MLENQPDSPVANLRRITCRMSSHNSSPFSQDGASGKAGAVQSSYTTLWDTTDRHVMVGHGLIMIRVTH